VDGEDLTVTIFEDFGIMVFFEVDVGPRMDALMEEEDW